jgi:hypothetical protein
MSKKYPAQANVFAAPTKVQRGSPRFAKYDLRKKEFASAICLRIRGGMHWLC